MRNIKNNYLIIDLVTNHQYNYFYNEVEQSENKYVKTLSNSQMSYQINPPR